MPPKTYLNDETSSEKSYLSQIASEVNAELRKSAKTMHEQEIVYALFTLLDSYNLSYSFLKYLFDILYNNNGTTSSDAMHDWLTTPLGGVTAAMTSISFIVFAMLANHFDDKDKNKLKRYLAISWPYFRDALKGSKNGLRGWYTFSKAFESLSGLPLSNLMVPIGLTLGILGALNRMWYRWMVTKRKEMMKANATILGNIQHSEDITLEKLEAWQQDIKKQSTLLNTMGFFSAAYGGFVDGLYLYIGVLGLCSFAPPVLAIMAIFSTLYLLTCMATRMYEEYDFQRKLKISLAKIALATSGKKIELIYNELHEISKKLASEELTDEEIQQLTARQEELTTQFPEEYKNFKDRQDELASVSRFGLTSALLAGLRDGLSAYGALTSFLFMIGAILSLTSVAVPPALIISCISFGLVCLTVFVIYSLFSAYKQYEKHTSTEEIIIAEEKLVKIRELIIDARQQVNDLEAEKIKETIHDCMNVEASQHSLFQEIFEIIRAFFAGWVKGIRAVSYPLNSFKELGADGHYHETAFMCGLMVFSCTLHAIIIALRAFCRAFGRPPIDEVPKPAANNVIDPGEEGSSASAEISDSQSLSSSPERLFEEEEIHIESQFSDFFFSQSREEKLQRLPKDNEEKEIGFESQISDSIFSQSYRDNPAQLPEEEEEEKEIQIESYFSSKYHFFYKDTSSPKRNDPPLPVAIFT